MINEFISDYPLPAALIAVCIVGLFLFFLGRADVLPQRHGSAAEVLTLLVLTATGVILFGQLHQIRGQGNLQRIVESRNSLQEMNKLLLSEDAISLEKIYPGMSGPQTKETIFAFSMLNAWEVAYHMETKDNRGEFQELLTDLIGENQIIKERWTTIKRMRTMYDPEFQKVVDRAFGLQ